MLNKRIDKKLIRNIVIGLVVFTITLGGLTLGFNRNKIENLENQLEMKQDIDNRNGGYSKTLIDTKTIENEFNKLNNYKIFEGKINMKHTYEYNRDSLLGMKAKGKLTATSDIYYQYELSLADADVVIGEDNKTINITLPTPKINEQSVHRVNDTFRIIEDESTNNFIMNDKDGMKIQQYWEETFDKRGMEEIKDYYSMEDKQDFLNSNAKKEIKDLLNTLGYGQMNLKIKINN